jgi:hypothetical protein
MPIEPWWLTEGLPCLIEEVRPAQRPVALVLLHRYNGLDEARCVAGLVAFMSAIGGLPVVRAGPHAGRQLSLWPGAGMTGCVALATDISTVAARFR